MKAPNRNNTKSGSVRNGSLDKTLSRTRRSQLWSAAFDKPISPFTTPKKELLFEALEPRLLLNADLPGVDILLNLNDSRDHDVLVRMVSEVNAASNENHLPTNRLQIIDLSNNNALLGSADVDTLSAVTLNLGDGDDRVLVDALSFGDQVIPEINVDGGGGSDELQLRTLSATVWDITGEGSGVASGPASLNFDGLELLTGSSDNEDTFILHESGSLAGHVDGGDGGFDVLELKGNFSTVTSTVFDASSGVIDLDGKLITYTGLEPITLGADSSVTSLVLNTGDSDDAVILEQGAADGTFKLSSAKGAFETHIFSNNVQTIVLGLGSGADSFTSTLSSEDRFQGDIFIDQTVDLTLGDVTGIDGSFTVNTVSGLHKADGTDLGWEGSASLDYDGSSVTLDDSVNIDITGDLSITVNASPVLNPSSLQEFINAPIVRGILNVGDNANINANSVTMATVTNGEQQMHLGIDTAALIQIVLDDAKVANAGTWSQLDFVDNNDGTGSITRTGGSWLADGFAVGQDIGIENAINADNQVYQILDVSAEVVTVALVNGATMMTATELASVNSTMTVSGYSFVRHNGSEQISFAVDDDGNYLIARSVPVANAEAGMTGTLNLTHSDSASDTITRSSGSWLSDGFKVGQAITVRNAGVQNGNFTIAAITDTTLTLASGDKVTDGLVNNAIVKGQTLGSYIDEGFAVGDEFIVEGSEFNNGTYTIAEVYDRSLVLTSGQRLLAESIDLSAADAPDLVIQKLKADLALEEVPLVLMGPDGQVLDGSNGPLSFTQQELQDAYSNNAAAGDEILNFLETTPVLSDIFSAFTSFGVKVWVSDLTGEVILGQGSAITAAGDVSITSEVDAAVEAATPSIMLGVSVVNSVVSSAVEIQSGATISADGAVTVDASTSNVMESSMSVTTGTIQNPAQNVVSGALDGATSDELDPTGFSAFIAPTVAGAYLGPVGYIRVPGPAIAVSLGMADTDSSVTIAEGSAITASNIDVASANQYSYSVEAASTIFQPDANMGIGAAIAVSITNTDSVTTVAGELSAGSSADGDINISAESTVTYDEVEQADGTFERDYTGTNSVSSSTWVRDVPAGGGPRGVDGFSNTIADIQNDLRDATAFGDISNENPGQFELAAAISVLVSDNNAEVILSSSEDIDGKGGIVAGGNLNIHTAAVDKIFAGASGTAESGGELAVAGGVSFARYDNSATTTIVAGADLLAGGSMDIASHAEIPSNISLDETFYGNYQAAADQFEIDKAAANDGDYTEEEKAELLAEAQVKFNESIAAAAVETAEFMYNFASTYRLGLGGAEGGLLSTYVNSAAGGTYNSTDTREEQVFKKDGTTPVFTSTGRDKTRTVSNETQAGDYAISGNVNILEIHNSGQVNVGEDVKAIANEIVNVVSSAEMDTINMTGLASIRDILYSWRERAAGGDDGGAIVSGTKGGIGASVGIRVLETVARNSVAAGATLVSNLDAVNVDAQTRQMHININEMGSDGGEVGISGSVSVDVINTNTETLVDESAVIYAATDITLNATSDYLQVNAGIAGTETESGVAVGAALSVEVSESSTLARITDLDGNVVTPAETTIQAGGDINVTAKAEEAVITVSLAGALQKDPASTSSDSSSPAWDYEWGDTLTQVTDSNATASDRAGAVTSQDQGTQVGAAGAANVAISTATVGAGIGAGAAVIAEGKTRVDADFDRDSIMVEGGGLLDLTADGSDLAIAGAVGVVVFNRDIDALVNGATIIAGDLDVKADHDDLIVVISAGGAGAARADTAVGVSANIVVTDSNVDARIADSDVDLTNSALINANSNVLLVNVAGAIGLTLGGDTGVGAAIGVSHASGDVIAAIDRSQVTAGGSVIVHALHQHQVVSIVASAGLAGDGTGGAGQLTLHLQTGETQARIDGGATVSALNNLALIAQSQVSMVTVTGGLAVGEDSGVGISLASTNIYDRLVKAFIGNGATITADSQGSAQTVGDASIDGVAVRAVADDDIINIVAGVAVAGTRFAVQGSVLVDTNDTSIHAGIGSNNGTAGSYTTVTAGNSGNIVVYAAYDFTGINAVGGVSASFGKLALGASVDVSVHKRDVTAEVGHYSRLNADGSVLVDASLDATHVYVIFNAGVSRGSAGSGAVSVPVYNDTVKALLGNHSRVDADEDVAVTAAHHFDHIMVDVAVAAALADFAGGVSLGVVVQNDTVRALVGNNATVSAGDTVLVSAESEALIANAAGGIAVGGKAGAGASALLLVRNDDVLADIGASAALTGLAIGNGFVRQSPNGSGTHRGVSVIADSKEKIVGVAIQGSGGGTAGIAGAVPVTVITETTVARVQDGAALESGLDLQIRAEDNTELYNVAGNIAGGGTAAIGASIDIASVNKTTRVSLGDSTITNLNAQGVSADALGNIRIEAFAKEQIVSIAVGIAGAGTAAVGLNGGVYVLGLDTHATIGANAEVTADGSVVVDALQDTEIDMIAASLAGAGTAAIVGSFDIPIVDKSVTATVLDGANINAKAKLDAINTHTGGVSAEQSGQGSSFINTSSGSVATPTDAIDGSLNLSMPGTDQSKDGMFDATDYQADTANVTGVSITATSLDDLQSITGGIALAGNASVAVVADVDVANITTHATVGDGVSINHDTGNDAGANQSVNIAAGSALDHMGVLAAVAVSGGAGVSVVADVKAITTDTRAMVGDADIYARDDISIIAEAEEDLQSLVLSIAGGYVAVSPAVTVISLQATTTAELAAGGMLNADNNVLVHATDNTNIDMLDGGVAGGFAAVSPGVGIMVVEKTTTASIGQNTQVDARAQGNSTDGVQGLSVYATSSEDLDQVAFGAAGGVVAVGGSAAVIEVDSDTVAGVGSGAAINQKGYQAGTGPGDKQNVTIVAHNDISVDVVSGGMGIGLVGAGVGVGVLTVSNDTSAYLNGTINANDNVAVLALSDQDVKGVIFGGAGGAGALAAAVGVFDIGGDKSDTSYEYSDGDGQDQSDSADGDTVTTESKVMIDDGIAGLVGELTSPQAATGDENLDQTNQQTTDITASASETYAGNKVGSITLTDDIPAGTSAIIGSNSSVTTGNGDITVTARQNADFKAVVGGAAVGGVAASGGVGVATLDNDVTARINSGSLISSGGDISVNGILIQDAEFTGFAGAGAIGVALSATVVSLTDTSDVIAELGGTIVSARDVSVTATSEIGLFAETIQISLAAFGAAGGAVTIVNADGATTAGILDEASLGDYSNPSAVENIRVHAAGSLEIGDLNIGSGDNNAMATGGSGGAVAASVGYSSGTDKRDTIAYIGTDVDIIAANTIDVLAESSSQLDVVTKGGSGGLFAAGLMFSNAVISDSTTRAEVRNANRTSRLAATDVSVAVKGDKLANAQTLAVAFGGMSISGTSGTTRVTADVEATIGKGVLIEALQDIAVQTESDIEGDAFVESVSGGVVSGGFSKGDVEVTPTTTTTISADALLLAGGQVEIYTQSGQAEAPASAEISNDSLVNDGEFKINRRDANTFELIGYQIDPVTQERVPELDEDGNPTGAFVRVYGDVNGDFETADGTVVDTNAVELVYEILNLRTGDVVQLKDQGGSEGQYFNRDLPVIRVDRESIRLGATFNGTDLDKDKNLIRFETEHNLETGDIVSVSEPDALYFDGSSVVYSNDIKTRYAFGNNSEGIISNSFYLPEHGLQTGDAFIYNGGSLPLPGLIEGQTYYVITNSTYLPNHIQVASTQQDALNGEAIDLVRWGEAGSLTTSPVEVALNEDTILFGENSLYIADHGMTSGDVINLQAAQIGGYKYYSDAANPDNRADHYVIVTSKDTVQLALTLDAALAGDALELQPTSGPKILLEGGEQVELFKMVANVGNELSDDGVPANSFLYEGHSFVTGDALTMNGSGFVGDTITLQGINQSGRWATYYAVVDGDYLQIARTLDDANNGIVIDFTLATLETGSYIPQSHFELADVHYGDQPSADGTPANSLTIVEHGFNTGDEVGLNPGGVPVQGLGEGTFFVIVNDENTVQLAASLADALNGNEVDLVPIDGVVPSLNASGVLEYQIGQQSITPLVDDGLSGEYRVIKLDDFRVKLLDTDVEAVDRTFLSENSFYYQNNGFNTQLLAFFSSGQFQAGDFITYYEPGLLENIRVGDLGVEAALDPSGEKRYGQSDTSQAIFVEDHGYQGGETVWLTVFRYQGVYTVNVVDENLLTLTNNSTGEVFDAIDARETFEGVLDPLDEFTSIRLLPDGATQAKSIVGHDALRHGQGYYIVDADPGDPYLNLSTTPNGEPLTVTGSNEVSYGVEFAIDGNDLNRAWGDLELAIDVSGLASFDIDLMGPGGVDLNEVLNDVGDSVSSVTVRNTAGGAANVGTSDGFLNLDVTLDTDIEGALIADGSIRVDSNNKTFGKIDNQLVSIGVLGGVTSTFSEATYTEHQAITISGDAILDAGYTMVAKSETAPNVTTLSHSRGGAAISGTSAQAQTTVTIYNDIVIEGNASLSADGRRVTDFDNNPLPGMSIEAITGGLASNEGWASSGGLVAGSSVNDANLRNTSFTANTRVTVQGNAQINAYELLIDASNKHIDLDSTAYMTLGGLFAGGNARAQISANLTSEVLLGGSVVITGRDGVRIQALNYGNTFDTNLEMYIIALGGGAGWSETSLTTTSNVKAGEGVTIYGGDLLEVRAEDFGNIIGDNGWRGAWIGPVYTNDSPNHSTLVDMNADVHIDARDTNFGLEVDESGNIVSMNGVSVEGYDVGDQITGAFFIEAISGKPAQLGDIWITARGDGTDRVTGADGTFFYNTSSSDLTLINNSEFTMITQGIDISSGNVINKGEFDSDVSITADNSRELTFNIAFEAEGSDIEILSKGAVVITGNIENRKGRTAITSLDSSILAFSLFGKPVIRSQDLSLSAEQGSLVNLGIKLFDDGRGNVFTIDAADDVSLDLQSFVVGGSVSGAYTTVVPEINVAGDVSVNLRSAQIVAEQIISGGSIVVHAFDDSGAPISGESGSYSEHYLNGAVTKAVPVSVSGGGLGGYVASTLGLADITADNIMVEGLAEDGVDVSLNISTDIIGDGGISIKTDGSIFASEASGDMRIELIESTEADIFLFNFDGSIVDARSDSETDLIADRIQIISIGSLGEAGNALEVDERIQLSAIAFSDIYITKNQGDLRLNTVTSVLGDVTLTTLNGSILDASYDESFIRGNTSGTADTDISANSINLTANNGSLGTADYQLEVNGTIHAQADSDIALININDDMVVSSAISDQGNIILSALSPVTDSGDKSLSFKLLENGNIEAAGSIDIVVDDDIHAAKNSKIEAGTLLTINGDADFGVASFSTSIQGKTLAVIRATEEYQQFKSEYPEATESIRARTITDKETGEEIVLFYTITLTGTVAAIEDASGSNMLFEGYIASGDGAFIHGGSDQDSIHFNGATLAGEVTAFGYGSDDLLIVTRLNAMQDPVGSQVDGSIIGRDVLNLVGGEGVDDVDIYTHGSGDVSNEYVINIDSDALDSVAIHGADDSDDIFLMRETLGVASYPGGFNMVSVINGTLEEATTSGGPESVQRINVSTNVDQLWVSGRSGEDYFAVDSFTDTELLLAGGEGPDTYVFGQFFGSKRDQNAQVAALDQFGTSTRTIGISTVEVSPSSDKPAIILDGFDATTGSFEDKVVVSDPANLPLGAANAKAAIQPAVLMPGELNDITLKDLPGGGDVLLDDSAILVVTDTATTDVASIDVPYTAGSNDLASFTFDTDTGAIKLFGLDSQASITWSLLNGELIANDGNADILKLTIASAPIAANTSGSVTVSATLMGAFAHESIVNVDTLVITGINLVATDSQANQTMSSIRVVVADAYPDVDLVGGAVSGTANEVLSGTWAAEAGADGLGAYSVSFEGNRYNLDDAIAIVREGQQIGTLTVKSDGTWVVAAGNALNDFYVNRNFDVQFGLTLTDGDQDSDSDNVSVWLTGSKIPDIPVQGEDAVLNVSDTLTSDVSSVDLTYTAGIGDIVSVTFGSDLSAIEINGLDDAASIGWSVVNGLLVGNNGSEDVISLEITADRIAGLNSGTVTLTATLMGALAHEDDVNVDTLAITGIELVATDEFGLQARNSVTVNVADAFPALSIQGSNASGSTNDFLSGTWVPDAGADGVGAYGVAIDGNSYGLDEAVTIEREGRLLGTMTISADGTWSLNIADKLWHLGGDVSYDIEFGITLIDSDGDQAVSNARVTVDVPAYVPATGEDATLNVTDTLTVDVDTDMPSFTAGTLDLTQFVFGDDFAAITFDGLDDAAAMNWSLQNGALVGNDGMTDVIRLEINAPLIVAGETAQITVTATLMGALAHEDNVNVDQLTISGVQLIAIDEAGFELQQTLTLGVSDSLPAITSSALESVVVQGEFIQGVWNVDAGADGLSQLKLLVDGAAQDFDQAIEIYRDNRVVGLLTVSSAGSWSLQALPDLWTADGSAALYDFATQISVTDGDQDIATTRLDLAIEVPAVVFVTISPGEVVVREDAIVDAQSIDLAVATGTFELSTITFSADTSGIEISGLDNEASLNWRVASDGRLIGNDGTADVIALSLDYDTVIPAESEGSVTLTATLLDAMSHEDVINVDSLTISNIDLVLIDGWGFAVVQSVSVSVIDDNPEVGLSNNNDIGNYRGAQVHSGTWQMDMGADDDGTVSVWVNGAEYAVGETIAVMYGEGDSLDYAGDLTVNSDGTWTFVGQKKTYIDYATVLDVSFGVKVVDGDGDSVMAETTFELVRILGRANNGVGNGLDPQPPGNPPENDTEEAVPGDPGNKGGADYDDGSLSGEGVVSLKPTEDDSFDSRFIASSVGLEYNYNESIILVTASAATPMAGSTSSNDELWLMDDATGQLENVKDRKHAPSAVVSVARMSHMGEDWNVV
ncbi:LEPR-XLL domain-containing protein [Marinobacter orientalis]|uniref:LEPR-XLL domain-containing protein n=1 Tax=Marinobacter orientalis TaxID=1928859 RepID=A0A7Y0REY8_9GAMM|nr:LEPR-XLL domain-containing protein [Marinobacter orientalis]NMT64999.1 LEPR-XLL domain-containing protein [Marinobacter orientalis]TGX48110.1 LEPR-XLL domain-containing protein [Marinobacter orientalis]